MKLINILQIQDKSMNKPLFSFLFFLLSCNIYLSQTTNNLDYLFDGEIKLENTVEEISPVGNTDNGLSVEININNKNYKFLVDTGASVSVLSDQIFKDIVNPNKKIKIKDALGNEEEKDVFYLDFKIGKNQFSNFAFLKYDFSNFFKNNCSKYDGIIGANVLKKLNWKYLKKEDKLLYSKNSFTYEGFNKPARLKWFGSVPTVELKVNDYKFLVLIDTGHYGTIVLPKIVYRNNINNFYEMTKGIGNPISTINGSQKAELKRSSVKNLSLENYDFSEYEVIFTKIKPNIGNKIILENGFVFNFLNNEIAFGINEKKPRYAVLPKIKICKSETNKSQLELCFFWKEPYNKMLKLHDQIIKIDTTNLDDNQFCNMMEYMNNKNTSKKITFKRGNKQFDYIMN
jgi:predicted aspartyl protease